MTRISPRRRRATGTLEFAMVLPLFLLLITFIVDVSRVMMISNAVNTSAYRAAREAAIRGGGDVVCPSSGTRCYIATFNTVLTETPGGSMATVTNGPTVLKGARCSAVDPIVVIEARYSVRFLTPGLATVMGLAGGGFNNLGAKGVSRCEVTFQ
jgi:hypothetical protein